MSTPFKFLAIVAMIAVTVVLVRGLLNLMRAGPGSVSNKLMQARVALQALAVVFLLLAIYFGRTA